MSSLPTRLTAFRRAVGGSFASLVNATGLPEPWTAALVVAGVASLAIVASADSFGRLAYLWALAAVPIAALLAGRLGAGRRAPVLGLAAGAASLPLMLPALAVVLAVAYALADAAAIIALVLQLLGVRVF